MSFLYITDQRNIGFHLFVMAFWTVYGVVRSNGIRNQYRRQKKIFFFVYLRMLILYCIFFLVFPCFKRRFEPRVCVQQKVMLSGILIER
jgi:hypothetical protein